MKLALEVLSETFAAAAVLWVMSARVRLRKPASQNVAWKSALTIQDCFCGSMERMGSISCGSCGDFCDC
jgi:hypothetical protein